MENCYSPCFVSEISHVAAIALCAVTISAGRDFFTWWSDLNLPSWRSESSFSCPVLIYWSFLLIFIIEHGSTKRCPRKPSGFRLLPWLPLYKSSLVSPLLARISYGRQQINILPSLFSLLVQWHEGAKLSGWLSHVQIPWTHGTLWNQYFLGGLGSLYQQIRVAEMWIRYSASQLLDIIMVSGI